jgi:hypothetical protein
MQNLFQKQSIDKRPNFSKVGIFAIEFDFET